MFEEYTGPAAIFEFDEKNDALVLIRANHKYLKLFELQDLSFTDVRRNLKNLVGKASTQILIETVKKSLAENEEATCNAEVRTYKKQNPIWIKNHIWEISHNGDKHSFYLLAEDITSEKISESTLELSNNQLAMLMDNSQVGMCLLHVEVDFKHILTGMRTRFLRANQSFLEMSGYSEKEVLSWTEKEGMNIIHPKDRAGFKVITVKAFLGKFKKPYSYDYRAIKKDGSYRKVRILVTGIQQPDKSFMLITNYILLD
jgi:PAS domain S-box-containing protein